MRISRVVVVSISSHQIVAFKDENRPRPELANRSERAFLKQRTHSDIERLAEALFVSYGRSNTDDTSRGMEIAVGCIVELQKATAACNSEMMSHMSRYVRLIWVGC